MDWAENGPNLYLAGESDIVFSALGLVMISPKPFEPEIRLSR